MSEADRIVGLYDRHGKAFDEHDICAACVPNRLDSELLEKEERPA